MVFLEYKNGFTRLIIGNEDELVLNIVVWISDLLLLNEKIAQLVLSMNGFFKYYNLILLGVPFFITHLLKEPKTVLLNQFGPSFVQNVCFFEQVFFHCFKFESFKEKASDNVGYIFLLVKQENGVKWLKLLASVNFIHVKAEEFHDYGVDNASHGNRRKSKITKWKLIFLNKISGKFTD